MDETSKVTWFAGLFEGEGYFLISKRSKRLCISMTDLDVLLRVQEWFGGKVYPLKKRQEHHKDAWIWVIYGPASLELAKKIEPYLLHRRRGRCNDYINLYSSNKDRSNRAQALRDRVRSLREQGLTHQQIAEEIGKDRTYVTHILRGRFD